MSYFWLGDPDRDYTSHNETPSGQNAPNGNISDTPQGINGTYLLQGIRPGVGITLLERAGHAARELGPFAPRLDGCLGTLGLIAMAMMTRPLPDCSPDLAALSLSVRD
jgi:hypothetical protein